MRNSRIRNTVIGAGILAAASGQALSTTINVPADFPTIQEAINAAPNGALIEVAPGTYNEAIDFIGKSLTVVGAGAGQTTIDASTFNAPAVTMFGIVDGARIGGVTIIAGAGVEELADPADPSLGTITFGGGLYIVDSSAAIRDSVIRDGAVTGSGGGGWVVNSVVQISGTEFRNNSADDTNTNSTLNTGRGGGLGVASGSLLTVTNSLFTENQSSGTGSSISVVLSDASIENSVFDNNTSTGRGAGVGMIAATVDITGCTFTNNTSNSSGGAVSVDNSTANVSDTTFTGNTSVDSRGGAASVLSGVAFFTDCTFTGNISDNNSSNGGALNVSGADTEAFISGCLFEDNSGFNRGGAIFVLSAHVDIEDSIFRGNSSVRGGAIHFNSNSTAHIRDSVFDNNVTPAGERSQGTAIYALGTNAVDPEAEILFENCQFINHVATGSGRGIIYSTLSSSVGGGNIRIADSLFEDNTSTDRGAVGYVTGDSGEFPRARLTVERTTMINNTADGRGGAFYVGSGALLTLESSTIVGSTSGARGGAVYLFRGDLTAINSRFANCESAEGAVISARASGSGGCIIEIDGGALIDNTSDFGGAIFSQGSTNNPNTLTANRVLITGNEARFDEAGGITFIGGSLAVSNSLIADNQGSLTGALYADNADVLIVNSTIANNPADPFFGFVESIFMDSGTNLTVQNSILWNDQLSSTLPMISLGSDSNMTAEWSNIQGGEAAVEVAFGSTTNWVAGNIDDNPLFVNSAGSNYRLGEDSPSVDAGDSSLVVGDFDLDGNDRIINAVNYPATGPISPAVDHGAYEAPADLPGGTGPTCPPDLNGDGVVDADDFFLFLSLFASGDPRADFNNDGVIDADDFFAFLGAFAAGC
ncbi:MAG: hypothetical protein EA423_02020 [Phycisphaerales bacterium]|nr:MAG: hypothetical protein EA423_02020 [Phycisphaerales bacterium]